MRSLVDASPAARNACGSSTVPFPRTPVATCATRLTSAGFAVAIVTCGALDGFSSTCGVARLNCAVTIRSPFNETVHAPVPEHAPPHAANVDPDAAAAVKFTSVPEVNVAEQVAPQLIAAGVLVTVP